MPDSLDTCGQKPSLQRKSCGFKNIRIRCGRGPRILFTDNIQSGGSFSVNYWQLYFLIRFQTCFGCLPSEGFNNPFFSLFFVAFQRPSVNEPELNNQLNNNLRLRAFMIVCILGCAQLCHTLLFSLYLCLRIHFQPSLLAPHYRMAKLYLSNL